VLRQYISLAPELMKRTEGLYESSGHEALRIEAVEGHLFAKPGDDPWMPIFTKSEREFFSTDNDATWTFTMGRNGAGEVVKRSDGKETHWTQVAK
jgi:hypothetical protein